MVPVGTVPSLRFYGAWLVMARAELSQAILAVLAGNPENPLKLADIAGLVDRPARDGSLRRALAGLVEGGRVERVGNDYRGVAPAGTAMALDGTSALSDDLGVPAHLGEAGRAAWELATGVNWTDGPDAAQIAHFARLEDEAARLVAVISEQGVTQQRPIVTPKGDVVGTEFVAHPCLIELRKLDVQLVTLRASLGLDPVSRARTGLQTLDPESDALDEIAEQRRKRRLAIGVAS